MPKKSGSGGGSLYFDKSKNKWIVQRYITDYKTGKTSRKTKGFSSEEEWKKSNRIYSIAKRIQWKKV